MSANSCFNCGAFTQLGDSYCDQCGVSLRPTKANPVGALHSPSQATAVSDPVGQSARTRRSWRHFIGRVLVTLLLLAVLGGGYVAFQVSQTLNSVHSFSDPPAQIDVGALGGTPGTPVDTGPALTAIATYSQEPGGQVLSVSTAVNKGDGDGDIDSALADAAPLQGLAQENSGTPAAVVVPDTVQTFLLMGVDARPGESVDIGVRPDSLAVAAYDTATNACRLLSIQRDSRVDLPGYGMSKINHALAVGGIPYQKLVVEQFLGIEIDHYALIDFTGVTAVVDEIGGVDLVITDDSFSSGGYTFDPGPAHLDGKEALAYSRYRYGPDGDFGRIRRQHQVMAAAIDKLARSSAPSMAKVVPSTLDTLSGHLRTDLGVGELTDLATDVIEHCSRGNATDETIQGTAGTFHDPLMNMDLWYLVVDEADRDRKVRWLVTGEGQKDETPAPTGTPVAVQARPLDLTRPVVAHTQGSA